MNVMIGLIKNLSGWHPNCNHNVQMGKVDHRAYIVIARYTQLLPHICRVLFSNPYAFV